jgi:hypothetical protein
MGEFPMACCGNGMAIPNEDAGDSDDLTSEGILHDGPAGSKLAFDLEERTATFGEAVILFARKIPRSPVNDGLISQLVRAATGIGANYAEADDGVSKKDFKHKIGICRKEARDEILSANGCRCRNRSETRSSIALARGQGITPDILFHLAEHKLFGKMNTALQILSQLGHLSFCRHSSLGIRHSPSLLSSFVLSHSTFISP